MTMLFRPAGRAAIAGVLYAEDFDEPERPAVPDAPEPPPPPPPVRIEPTFSLLELQGAIDRAVEEGKEIERRAAEQDVARSRAVTLERLAASLECSQASVRADAAAVAEALSGAVLAALAALLPELCVRHGAREAALVLRRLLPLVRDEPVLVVRARPDVLAWVREATAGIAADRHAAIEWRDDPAMGPDDLSASWRHGAAARDGAGVLREIVATLLPPEGGSDHEGSSHAL